MLEKLTKSPDPKFTANWNELAHSVVQLLKMRVGSGLILKWIGGVPSLALSDQTKGIPFYNDSGEAAPAWAYMPVTGYDTTKKILKVGKPSTTFYQAHLINSGLPIPYQQTGFAQDSLEQRLLYNSGTPAVGEGYGPTPGQWYATKNYPQASVCQGIHDSSAKIMLATLGVIEKGLAKSNGTIANAGSGAISIYAGAGAWTTDTGQDPTAVNIGPPVVLNDLLQFDHLNGQMVFSKVCTT